MKERPILFSGAMVRAILEGRKTQTRRIVKPQPPQHTREVTTFHHPDPRTHYWAFDGESLMDWAQPCPYGEVGDRLYVRETWQHSNHPFGPYESDCLVFYRADYFDDPHGPDGEKSPEGKYREWRPSIHMPRAASRITLEVTDVRVERLQEISEADAIAEGVESIDFEREERDWSICPRCGGTRLHEALGPNGGVMFDVDCRECDTHVKRYRHLWDSLNTARGYGWDANSWVWVVEFKRIES